MLRFFMTADGGAEESEFPGWTGIVQRNKAHFNGDKN
jgi:hypothetical protein